MPIRPPKPCGHPACRKYAKNKGRCDDHQIKHNWQHTKNRHERGYGSQWEKIRKQVLKRDRHLCQECLKQGIYTNGNQVDHIKPKSQGGSDDLSNLQVLCHTCHKEKTFKEALDARNN